MTDKELPEVIIAMGPYMQELLSLRKENKELRFKQFSREKSKSLIELFAEGGWEMKQGVDGKWSCSIPLRNCHTGTAYYDSPEQVAVSALKRSREMVFQDDDE